MEGDRWWPRTGPVTTGQIVKHRPARHRSLHRSGLAPWLMAAEDVMPTRSWSDLSERTRRWLITAAVADCALRVRRRSISSADRQARSGAGNRCGPQSWHWSAPPESCRTRTSSSGNVGSHDPTPRLRSGRSDRRMKRPVANTALTTVVDSWGRSWTPRCPGSSSGLFRRTVVDSRGPGHSPENRTARWA